MSVSESYAGALRQRNERRGSILHESCFERLERKVIIVSSKLRRCFFRNFIFYNSTSYFRDKKHVDWARGWVELLTELQKFVKQYHTTGLVWAGGKSAGGFAPPPPPGGMPPPPPPVDLCDLSLGDSSNDRSALFAEINQGENITKSNY